MLLRLLRHRVTSKGCGINAGPTEVGTTRLLGRLVSSLMGSGIPSSKGLVLCPRRLMLLALELRLAAIWVLWGPRRLLLLLRLVLWLTTTWILWRTH